MSPNTHKMSFVAIYTICVNCAKGFTLLSLHFKELMHSKTREKRHVSSDTGQEVSVYEYIHVHINIDNVY